MPGSGQSPLPHEQIYNAADLNARGPQGIPGKHDADFFHNMLKTNEDAILHSLDTTKMPVPLEKAIPCALILKN
jgi:hypothetical protein